MLNIREIAKIAGVGKSTVSRVINQTGYVSDETRKKIEAVMQEYEYSPSAVARNLSKQQTNSIGIIIPQANNPFFDEILTGVESIAGENGYTISFSNTANDPKKERDAIKAFIEQRVSGMILQPTFSYEDSNYQAQLRKLLMRLHAPVVVVDVYKRQIVTRKNRRTYNRNHAVHIEQNAMFTLLIFCFPAANHRYHSCLLYTSFWIIKSRKEKKKWRH